MAPSLTRSRNGRTYESGERKVQRTFKPAITDWYTASFISAAVPCFDPEADDILQENGVFMVPDVLANAGGVTVSYFEWVQDFSNFFWNEDEINQRLTRIMRDAYKSVAQTAREHKVSLRTAAFIVACTRILQAREMRGLYP